MKYKLTENTIVYKGYTLFQIIATRNFSDVIIGELGGYIERIENLSQEGNCWVHDTSKGIW